MFNNNLIYLCLLMNVILHRKFDSYYEKSKPVSYLHEYRIEIFKVGRFYEGRFNCFNMILPGVNLDFIIQSAKWINSL